MLRLFLQSARRYSTMATAPVEDSIRSKVSRVVQSSVPLSQRRQAQPPPFGALRLCSDILPALSRPLSPASS